jgi:predicted cation transporter
VNWLRSVGIACLVAVVVGPAVWIASLVGFRMTWLSVRSAFISMLIGFILADTVALLHVAMSSRTKREKWKQVQRMTLGFQVFYAFEYLLSGGQHSRRNATEVFRRP